MDDVKLRNIARTLFTEGVRAADPGKAVSRALVEQPLPDLNAGTQYIIAIGKAAGAMMKAALSCVPSGQKCRAIAVTNYENAFELPGCEVYTAAHPVPDENGLKAGMAVKELAASAGPNDHVLCLVSGGGSALLPAPKTGMTLADKVEVNKILLANGFDIIETNLVRQNLSELKGGGLAQLASPAKIRTLILSDVIGDDPSAIASGPTAKPLGSAQEAIDTLKSRGVWEAMPERAKVVLAGGMDKETTDIDVVNSVICSNTHSLEAIADAADGLSPRIITAQLGGDVNDAANSILSTIDSMRGTGPKVLIWGGETTVTLTGNGKGGRNQELALRVALKAETLPGNWVFLSGGTDGRDGPTHAAGGIVDANTIKRISERGEDAAALLRNNDSNKALDLAGDLLTTGATGTNVADIQLFMMGK
ncbi:glycerate kinase type-2 family protein [Aliiroseovarius sp. 2305UL8-7]|uniref:glycerate kinase type-2 family protein n=1 Tax=Aliiroseovarius conchicola TaxID=3121637 RepID=UPI003527F7FB